MQLPRPVSWRPCVPRPSNVALSPLALAGLLSALLSAGCGSDKKISYAPSEFPELGSPAKVKLIDAGQDPKATLRFGPKQGDRVEQRLELNMTMEAAGLPQKIEMPVTSASGNFLAM